MGYVVSSNEPTFVQHELTIMYKHSQRNDKVYANHACQSYVDNHAALVRRVLYGDQLGRRSVVR